MKKLKLNLDDLQVDSFIVSPEGRAAQGTVEGYGPSIHNRTCGPATCATCGTSICPPTCNGSCDLACGYTIDDWTCATCNQPHFC